MGTAARVIRIVQRLTQSRKPGIQILTATPSCQNYGRTRGSNEARISSVFALLVDPGRGGVGGTAIRRSAGSP